MVFIGSYFSVKTKHKSIVEYFLKRKLKNNIMNKRYLQAAILLSLYLCISTALIISNQVSDYSILTILLYPGKLCIQPFLETKLNFEAINLSLFSIYFMWSLSCVYLHFITNLINSLKTSKISRR